MSGVQRTHGRNEADTSPQGALGLERVGELGRRGHDAHGPDPPGPPTDGVHRGRARHPGYGDGVVVGGSVVGGSVADQSPGQGHAGLVAGDLVAVEGPAVPVEGGLVAAGGGTGERGGGAELGHVGQRGPGEAHERVEVEPGRRRHPLDLAHERHQVVRGDAGGGVVGGTVLVVDGHDGPVEQPGQIPGHRVTGHGEGDPAAEPDPADLGGGQRDERVQ